MKSIKIAFLILLIIVANYCAKKEDVIKIGVVLPMTGNTATFGIECANGIKLAIDKINSQGGVKGKKLEVILEDDKGEPLETANATKKLIEINKVIVILGSVTSSNTLAAAPIAQQARTPLLSPASTNVAITKEGEYISRICFIDPFQGAIMAKFAIEDLNASTAFVIIDSNSDYSRGLAEAFIQKFEEMGKKILGTVSYVQKDTDFSSQITKIKEANPDIVFIPGYYSEVALILRQMEQLGAKYPVLGGDGWDSPKLYEVAGDSAEGHFLSTHFSADDTDPMVQDFVRTYKERFKALPGAMAALGYDAALVTVDALNRASSLTREALKDAINSTANFKGITGVITINQERNAVKSAVILKAHKDRFEFYKRVNP